MIFHPIEFEFYTFFGELGTLDSARIAFFATCSTKMVALNMTFEMKTLLDICNSDIIPENELPIGHVQL